MELEAMLAAYQQEIEEREAVFGEDMARMWEMVRQISSEKKQVFQKDKKLFKNSSCIF